MVELLRAFPALWAIIGLAIGGTLMFYVTKKYAPMQSDALTKIIESHEKLAATEARRHESQLATQREHLTEALTKLERDRDDYKSKLHIQNNISNNLALKVQELELRPTVEGLQSSQQEFFREMIQTIKNHDEGAAQRWGQLHEVMHETAQGVKELVVLTKNGNGNGHEKKAA